MADTSLIFNILAKDKASKALDGFKDKLKNVLAVGAAAAGAFAVASINSAADLAETQSKIGQIFGSSAGAVESFAGKAATSLGQSKQQAMDAAATFATFGKTAGLSGQELVGFSTDLTTLSSDMASFNNTSPEQAIEAVGAALRGESEPIRAYGVMLDEATLKAQAMSMGLVKAAKDTDAIKVAQMRANIAQANYNKAVGEHGKGSLEAQKAQASLTSSQNRLNKLTEGSIPPLTNQQKVLAAQGAIMAQAKTQQGDFARTSGGLANQQRILKAQLANTSAEVGTKLLPVALKLTTWALGAINWMKEHSGLLKTLAMVLGPIAAIIATVVAITKVWTIVQTALNIVMAMNPVGLIVLAVIALIAIIVIAWKKSETFRNIVIGVWNAIKAAVLAVGAWFKDTLWPWIKGVFTKVQGIISGVWGWIKRNWPYLLGIITGPIGMAVVLIVKHWGKIKAGVTAVKDWIVSKFKSLVEFIRSVPGKISSAASGMFNGIKDAFKSAVNWIIGKWNNLSFGIPSVDTKIPGVGRVGGMTLHTPNIPYLAKGGTAVRAGMAVVGDRGPETVHLSKGATVTPLDRRGGGQPVIVQFVLDGKVLAEGLIDPLRESVRKRGGNVQSALGRG